MGEANRNQESVKIKEKKRNVTDLFLSLKSEGVKQGSH